MTLRFTVLGFELARVDLDIEHQGQPAVETVVETVVDRMSDWWVQRMLKKRSR